MNYEIVLTQGEYSTLGWLAERYTSAERLVSCELVEHAEPGLAALSIPEPVAWQYLDDLAEENGNPDQMLPTCAGGTLAEKLLAFYESIV